MSNPINRLAVCSALGISPDYATTDVFKRLVSSGLLPAPLDAGYDTFDLTAIQGKVASAASVAKFAGKVVTEHRGGQKAVI